MDKIKQQYQQIDELHKRIHRVFVQTQDGKELLDMWKDHVLMSPVHLLGSDPYQLGLAEGRKEFIRELITSIKQAEAKND